MSFPRYPKYKDSGVEWLGEVPEHWEVSELKWLIDRNDGGVWGDDPDGVGDTLVLRSTEQTVDGRWKLDDPAFRKLSDAEIGGSLLLPGDLLLTKSSGSSLHIGKTTLVTDEIAKMRCCYSNFMQRIRLRQAFLPKLAWYILNNDLARLQFDLLSNSTTGLANLNGTMIGQIMVTRAPLPEQTAIAAFLDRETGKIDELVAEQRRLMDLLKEKRQAVISHAVTKGLNPRAPMKDSGIEWLGEVPGHWVQTQIKRIARSGEKTFVDGDWIETPYITTEGVRLIQCGNVGMGVFEEQGFRYVSEETFDHFDCTEVEPGNVLICRLQSSRTILAGRACLAPELGVKMITSVDNCILKPSSDFDPRYIVYLLSTTEYLSYIEVVARGGTRDRISRTMLGNIGLAAPPLGEQSTIADYLDKELIRFDTLASEAQRAIDLLQERRTALISAAVTGQIDVRRVAG